MEFDLQRGLHDLSSAPPVAPDAVPTDRVLARVHRGRALRATSIAMASAAAVLAVGAVVYASPWQAPAPADTPTPTSTTPAPTPTQEPSPEPTPTPTVTQTPVTAPSPIALTAAGELVELDPRTGAALRQIAVDADWSGPLAVDRELGHVYLTNDADRDSAGWPGTVQRVTIADGTVVDIAQGRSPALAPAGGTLAFISVATIPDTQTEDHALIEVNAVTTLDLVSGETRSAVDAWPSWGARGVGYPVWSADGARVYVHVGWADAPFGEQVLVVDPSRDTALDEAAMAVEPRDALQSWTMPLVLPDGRLTVQVDAPGPAVEIEQPGQSVAWETGAPDSVDVFAAVVDPASGAVLDHLPVPGYDVDRIVAAAPDGSLAFIDWRNTSGEASAVLYLAGPDGVLELGRATWGQDGDVDEGIVAIAW